MTFTEEIKTVGDKVAAGVSANLSILGGPSSSRRRLLMSAMQSTLLIYRLMFLKTGCIVSILRKCKVGVLRVPAAYLTISRVDYDDDQRSDLHCAPCLVPPHWRGLKRNGCS